MLYRKNIKNVAVALASGVFTLMLSGCATVEPHNKATQSYSVTQAVHILKSGFGVGVCTADNLFTCNHANLPIGNKLPPNVQLSIANLVINGKYKYELSSLETTVSVHTWPGDGVFLVFNGGMTIAVDYSSDSPNGNILADALLTLKNVAVLNNEEIGDESDAAFQNIVLSFRSAATKPTIPENARMYKLQAEDAIRNKEFEEAAYRYSEALKVAPWFAQAHFNRALVLGEINEFGFAVKEMKRYLALVPDAPDASAAQKQIYIWQGKVEALN